MAARCAGQQDGVWQHGVRGLLFPTSVRVSRRAVRPRGKPAHVALLTPRSPCSKTGKLSCEMAVW